jgi:hypothetical protein
MCERSAPGRSFERRAARAALVLTLLGATRALAAPLELAAESALGDAVTLRVTATNHGSGPVAELRPEVGYRQDTHPGEPLGALAAGAAHTWTFTLPSPPGPGRFPATVRVAYRNGVRADTALLVHLVATPGVPLSEVETALRIVPVTGYGHERLTLANAGDAPLVGRVIIVLPHALDTEPESRPVTIPARARTEVPFDVRDRDGVPGESYPFFVLFEYESEGVHQAIIDTGPLLVRATAHPPVRPLVVGGIALLIAFAVLAGALRYSRP